jgi:AcrR family transcriptional regulator
VLETFVPRVVDHAQRRAELAEAVWRVVRRDGIEHASVREVAREANLSMGSLRYFFDSQDGLLRFAMEEVIRRVQARIEAGAPAREAAMRRGKPGDAVIDLLEQVLPLDDERLAEAQIWLAFTPRALIDPQLHAVRRQADDGVRELCRQCLLGLSGFGLMTPERSLHQETERLWALIDGLTLHLVTGHTSRRTARRVLRAHLAELR